MTLKGLESFYSKRILFHSVIDWASTTVRKKKAPSYQGKCWDPEFLCDWRSQQVVFLSHEVSCGFFPGPHPSAERLPGDHTEDAGIQLSSVSKLQTHVILIKLYKL